MAEYEAEERYEEEGNGGDVGGGVAGGEGGGGGGEDLDTTHTFPSSASSPQPLDQSVSKSRVRFCFSLRFSSLFHISI
jgi:hypothetical protein